MANLAQTVNVLQSVVLTEGDRMVLTPTWHVFDLYKDHQDAKLADCFVETDQVGEGKWQVEAYEYDYQGRMLRKTVNGQETRYWYKEDSPVPCAMRMLSA